jgi:hypothetical protein|tara:strand:+ start:86488 stop:87564 length:1077 start_codon:yes stop_codon:yes gene_type:complete
VTGNPPRPAAHLGRYRTGDPGLDSAVEELVQATGRPDDLDLIAELLVSALRLGSENVDRGELKLVNSALKELRHSFAVFAPYRGIRKATIFGSARIREGDPAYRTAAAFGEAIAERGWMVITGAGPGIMAAGMEGAGADRSFGVNIQLPFENAANEVITDDPKLINFRYFFTRKVMFMKESHGYALLPGGFGTMDETFELLTLMQTGKSPIAPVVLLDPPESTYWDYWTEFVEKELVEGGLISGDDLSLVFATDDPVAAADHICDFYSTYHSMRYVGKRLILRVQRQIGDEELVSLNDAFSDLLVDGRIERSEPTRAELADNDELALPRLVMNFDRHAHARLRQLIDCLNSADQPGSA